MLNMCVVSKNVKCCTAIIVVQDFLIVVESVRNTSLCIAIATNTYASHKQVGGFSDNAKDNARINLATRFCICCLTSGQSL